MYLLFVSFHIFGGIVKTSILVQDMTKVSFHFVRGGQPEKFAATLVNFMGKVSLAFFFSFQSICVENPKEIMLEQNGEEILAGPTWWLIQTLNATSCPQELVVTPIYSGLSYNCH